MSLPSTRIRPSSTSSSPPSARRAVVLPQPDGPRSAISSPGAMSIDSPLRAWTEPYQRCMSWNSTATPWPVAIGAGLVAVMRRAPRAGWPRRSAPAAMRVMTISRTNAKTRAERETATEMNGSRLPSRKITTCSVLNDSSDEIVYSPSTSAIARTEADRIPPRMFGTITWRIVRGQPAPRLRAASASVAVSIDRRLASIAR